MVVQFNSRIWRVSARSGIRLTQWEPCRRMEILGLNSIELRGRTVEISETERRKLKIVNIARWFYSDDSGRNCQ
jgi:hypothetical protein